MAGASLLLLLLQIVLHQNVQAGASLVPFLTVSSPSTSSGHWAKGLGLYTLEGPDSQGNPVWKLGDKEWFIYYREKRWRVGDKSDYGYIRSEETGTDVIPETSWEYYYRYWKSGSGITVKETSSDTIFTSTTTITATSTTTITTTSTTTTITSTTKTSVKGTISTTSTTITTTTMTTSITRLTPPSKASPDPSYYPATLTVNSHDAKTKSFNGEFILVPGDTVNGQPIWKNGGKTISYKRGRWTVEDSKRGFRSPKTRPEVFPETGWQYKAISWSGWYDRDNFEVEGPVDFPRPGALKPGVNCQNMITRGQDYTGAVNTAINGHSCKAWTDTVRPSVGNHSYCRNPTWGSSGLWCYTTTSGKKWEYCHVPECQDNGGDKNSLIHGLSVGAGVALATSIVIFAVCLYLSRRSTTVPEHGRIERNEDYGVYGEDYEETEMRDENPYYGAAVEGWEGERVTDVNEDYGRV